MSEHSSEPLEDGELEDGPDVAALLKKIQLQLAALERKIDALADRQPQENSFRGPGGGGFSKPHRPFGGRPDHRRHDGPRGESPRRYERPLPPDRAGRGGFDKPSYSARPDRGGFSRPHGGSERGAFPKKKKNFYRKG